MIIEPHSRRSFFRKLLVGVGAFTILPPALTYDRIWRASRPIIYPPNGYVTCEFIQHIIDQVPMFDELILKDVKVMDGWLYPATGCVALHIGSWKDIEPEVERA